MQTLSKCFAVAVHKQRDVIPLNISDDIGPSDEDDEHHVFDIQVIGNSVYLFVQFTWCVCLF